MRKTEKDQLGYPRLSQVSNRNMMHLLFITSVYGFTVGVFCVDRDGWFEHDVADHHPGICGGWSGPGPQSHSLLLQVGCHLLNR